MGEEADYIIDKMIDSWDDHSDYHYKKPKNFQSGTGHYMWKQADGTVIPMHTMSLAHIDNAIKICRQKKNTAKEKELFQTLVDRCLP